MNIKKTIKENKLCIVIGIIWGTIPYIFRNIFFFEGPLFHPLHIVFLPSLISQFIGEYMFMSLYEEIIKFIYILNPGFIQYPGTPPVNNPQLFLFFVLPSIIIAIIFSYLIIKKEKILKNIFKRVI